MTRSRGSARTSIERRRFLTQGAPAGAAALAGPPGIADAQSTAPAGPAPGAATLTPTAVTLGAETAAPVDVQVLADNEGCGSDSLVDVLKSLGFEYICANPGSSFGEQHSPARALTSECAASLLDRAGASDQDTPVAATGRAAQAHR